MSYNNQYQGANNFYPGQQQSFGSDNNQSFPSFGQQFEGGNNQASGASDAANPFASAAAGGSNPFSTGAKSFVPQGVMATTEEEFPEIGKVGASKKKKGKSQEELQAEKQAELDKLPTKGKDPMFFKVPGGANRKVSQDQCMFVYQYYPQYSADPSVILDWLFNEANSLEEDERLRHMQAQETYAAPTSSTGKKNNNKDYDDYYYQETYDDNEDTTFGFTPASKKKKAGAQQKVAEVAPKKGPKNKDPEKAQRQAEEKKARIVKDVVVKIDEDEIVPVDESKQPCSLVFIGHVDAGKSTISGQIMLQMGCIDERTIMKYKQEAKDKGRDSWWLAYVMDVGEEEKAKGKTVEMGRATFATATKQFTVFDAPGHKNYVPNMIMGAALADYGGLVVSARKGEYEAGFEKEGQTREHVQLAKSLGVQKLVIVVNKMDDHSVNWSEDRWNEIRENISPFLIASGYKEDDFTYVPISGLAAQNLKDRVDPSVCSWYKGPSLIEALDALPVEMRQPKGPVRIPVLDKIKDQGIVAFGKIECGTVHIGDKIMLSPSMMPAQVGNILDHKNESVKYARPGENVQIRLIHVDDENQIQKGDVICMRDNLAPVTMLFEAELTLLELLDYKPIMSRGYTCIMHCHTIAEEVTLKDIMEATEKDPAGTLVTKEAPKFIRSNAVARVRITVKVPIAMEKHDVVPQMGRFTLRDEGKTIAVGKILRYKPHKVEASVVAHASRQEQAAAAQAASDKNAALVFDMESGATSVAKPQVATIPEEADE